MFFLAIIKSIISLEIICSLIFKKLPVKMIDMVVSIMGILEVLLWDKAKATDFYSLCC